MAIKTVFVDEKTLIYMTAGADLDVKITATKLDDDGNDDGVFDFTGWTNFVCQIGGEDEKFIPLSDGTGTLQVDIAVAIEGQAINGELRCTLGSAHTWDIYTLTGARWGKGDILGTSEGKSRHVMDLLWRLDETTTTTFLSTTGQGGAGPIF